MEHEMNDSLATTESELRQAHWHERIAQQVESGKSVAAFCREQGIATQTFYWWRARLAGRARPAGAAQREAASFIDLGALRETAAEASGIDIRLDLGYGIVLTIARR
jgi:hypothetical protein